MQLRRQSVEPACFRRAEELSVQLVMGGDAAKPAREAKAALASDTTASESPAGSNSSTKGVNADVVSVIRTMILSPAVPVNVYVWISPIGEIVWEAVSP